MMILLCVFSSEAQNSLAHVDSLMNKSRVGFSAKQARSLNMQIYKKSVALNYKPGIAHGLLFIALNHFNGNRYNEALKAIHQAEEVERFIGNPYVMARILVVKAECFAHLGFLKQSEKVFKEAQHHGEQVGDVVNRHHSMGNIYLSKASFFELNKPSKNISDSILLYAGKAHYEFEEIKSGKFRNALTISAFQLGKAYLRFNQYDSARYYFIASLANAKKFKQKMYAITTYMGLALLDYQNQQYQSALVNYFRALSISQKYEDKKLRKEIYLGLSNVYEKLGVTDQSNIYLKKYVTLSEMLNNSTNESAATPAAYIIRENERIYESRKNKYLYIIICIVVLMALGFIVAFFLLKRLKREKDFKMGQTGLLERKLFELQAQQPKIKIREAELKDIVELAMDNDPSFFIKFKEVESEFVWKILNIAPNLVASELEFCAYLRLHFKTNEIARFARLSVRAVQGKKHRIRKKLGISTSEDIDIWMSKL